MDRMHATRRSYSLERITSNIYPCIRHNKIWYSTTTTTKKYFQRYYLFKQIHRPNIFQKAKKKDRHACHVFLYLSNNISSILKHFHTCFPNTIQFRNTIHCVIRSFQLFSWINVEYVFFFFFPSKVTLIDVWIVSSICTVLVCYGQNRFVSLDLYLIFYFEIVICI